MNKIFVVVASGGRYEDVWEKNLFACPSQEAGDLAVLELKERDARVDAAADKLLAQYDELRERFPLKFEPLPQYPKGPSNGKKEALAQHTHAMAAYTAEFQRAHSANNRRKADWDAQIAAIQRESAKAECGLSDADMECITFPTHSRSCFGEDAEYSVEELEMKYD